MPNELDLNRSVADPVNTRFRYWAFISYSHKDERQAARLHRQIEGYTAHARLSGTGTGQTEPLPKRLFPVFRDREELAGAPDLSERIQEALRESRFLIVVCSRQSAQSKWVDEEIKTFKRLGREERVLAFIIDGEPNASDQPNSAAEECFPAALRYRLGADGAVTSERTEPLAADARAGKDGQRYAVLKLIAGILGVRYDDLRRRDQERSARRRNWITAGSLSAAAVFASIAAFAYYQQTIAQERSRIALSRQLAAQAMNDLPAASAGADARDYARGLVLAAQALATKSTVEARSTLLKAVLASPYRLRYLWGHTTAIASVAVSADGRIFAAAADDGSLHLWDAATYQPLDGSLAGLQGKVTSIAFSPRAAILAAGSGDSTVHLWNVSTRQSLGPALAGGPRIVRSLAFSPDGTHLAAGGQGERSGAVVVWNLATGGAPPPPSSRATPDSETIARVAFSPDSSALLSAGADGTMTIWDVATLVPLRSFEGQPAACVAFSQDGKLLATGGHSGIGTRRIVKYPFSVIVWDLATGTARGVASPPQVEDVRSVAFGAGNTLAAGGPDGRIFLWAPGSSETMQTIVGHKQAVTSMAFGPEGKALISGSADGAVVVRDLHEGAPLTMAVQEASSQAAAERNPFYRIDAVALSSDGKSLAWESAGGRIVLWDVPTGTVRRELAGTASVGSLTFTPDGKMLAAGTEKGVVLWDVATGGAVRPPVEHPQTVNPRIFAENGTIMALRMPDHSVMLWDVPKAEPRGAPRRGHASALTAMAFSPAGDILASASADGVVLLWDVASEQPRQPSFGGHHGQIVDLTFSADGRTLALVAYRDRQSMVTLWDIARGQRRDLLTPPNTTVESLVFSHDGSILIGAAQSGELLLWEVAHPEAGSSRLLGHSTPIGALAFSQEGDLLISVAGDTAIVWDIRTRMAIGRLSDGQRTRAVVFNRDSRVMVASSEWGAGLTVRDWDPRSWAKYACQAANRNLTRIEWEQFIGPQSTYEPACTQFEGFERAER